MQETPMEVAILLKETPMEVAILPKEGLQWGYLLWIHMEAVLDLLWTLMEAVLQGIRMLHIQ